MTSALVDCQYFTGVEHSACACLGCTWKAIIDHLPSRAESIVIHTDQALATIEATSSVLSYCNTWLALRMWEKFLYPHSCNISSLHIGPL